MNIVIIWFSIVNIIWALCFVLFRFIFRAEAPLTFLGYAGLFILFGLPGLVCLFLTILRMKGYPIALWHIVLIGLILAMCSLFYINASQSPNISKSEKKLIEHWSALTRSTTPEDERTHIEAFQKSAADAGVTYTIEVFNYTTGNSVVIEEVNSHKNDKFAVVAVWPRAKVKGNKPSPLRTEEWNPLSSENILMLLRE